jgi:hypothetical protein
MTHMAINSEEVRPACCTFDGIEQHVQIVALTWRRMCKINTANSISTFTGLPSQPQGPVHFPRKLLRELPTNPPTSFILLAPSPPTSFCITRCCNPSLRLATMARACKGCGPRMKPGSHILMLLGMQKSVREWTFTLPSELGSWWTPKFSKSNCKVKTHWIEDFFISLEILGMKMFKMVLHDPFKHF